MHDRLWLGRDDKSLQVVGSNKLFGDAMIQHRQKRVEVARDVEDSQRFLVQSQRGPGQGLEEFLERADAAWQRKKSDGSPCHHRFALVHVGDDVQFRQPIVGDLLGGQGLGDYADHLSAAIEDRVGDNSHQSDPPTPINHADTAAGQDLAHLSGQLGVCGLATYRRSAIDTDIIIHDLME